MTVQHRSFQEITEAGLLPKIIHLGGNLYGAAFTLMKMVPARHILRQAADRGLLGPDTVVVETTSGTFGLALAMQTALMRRRLILVSDPVIDRNLHRRLTDLGADIEIVEHPAERGGYQAARLERLARLRQSLPDTFCPEQYVNRDNPASYRIVAEHLATALGTIDCLVGPVGSGGSMCGTTKALRERSHPARAIAVDTHRSMLFGQTDGPRQLRGLGNSLMPANLDHTVFDEVHWCSAAEAYTATRWLHRHRALFQGPTSGAAFLAARWWADLNPDATCVVMLPDEGYRYQETVYDDSWLSRHDCQPGPMPDKPSEVDHPALAVDRWSRFAWGRRRLDEVSGPASVQEVGA